ncbi:MAG TPA: energy transducer TonB [Vicinamibacterales bacterium]|nr:energy transducer TonB [Vicinamibacterales bacterium]
MKSVLAMYLCLGVGPAFAPQAQVPRDTPPPMVEEARRERDLRATIAAGTATNQTYLELERLLWQRTQRYGIDEATKREYLRQAMEIADTALLLDPKTPDQLVFKNILLRAQADMATDPAEKKRLTDEASVVSKRAMEAKGQGTGSPFSEPFEQTVARLQPLRVGGNIVAPTKTKDVKPAYPPEAQTAHVQGVMIVEALVDANGKMANARILRSIPILDAAALDAVSQWEFTPTLLNGAPVSVIMTVTVNFSMME